MPGTTVADRPRQEKPRSARHSRKTLSSGMVVLAVVLVVIVVLSIMVGARTVAPGTVLDAILHYDSADSDQLVVYQLRVPRTLIGLLAGSALGLAGALIQGVTRNPLADPGILGINAGAALFVVLGISLFGMTSLSQYLWFAFAGAAVAAVAVYAIGSLGRSGANPLKLALSGAALTAALGSVTSAILFTSSLTYEQFRFWQIGSIAGRDLPTFVQAAPFLLAGIVLALGCGRMLNALAMGDDMARAWGARVGPGRAMCALAVVVLCGAATALTGPIGFVGLVVPHLARGFTGPDHRWILRYSMLLAPILLLLADIVGRLLARPGEIQVGLVTAAIGAPVFVWLVRRRRLVRL